MSGMTQPDTASALRAVARHAHNPAARLWKAVQKIIADLKATKDQGLLCSRGRGLETVVVR